ncbi:phenoloxidase-activating factor 3-like isoform X1 [Macrobrachium rosenbergii]|uniref:phenoloxidase-activating factor 3-like isoform X1 n=1 Tax=Macrobrachium rosenbergii TaxID=79674 RepID=UPI0034D61F4B
MKKQKVASLLLAIVVVGEAQGLGKSCSTTDRTDGLCVRIKDCPPIHEKMQKVIHGSGTQSSLFDVVRAFCSDSTLVCCALADIQLNETQTEPPSGMSLLPKNCGRARTPPVSLGPAPLGAWPWIVILRARYNREIFPICGGSLISERYVLTSSHCHSPESTFDLISATVGEYNVRGSPDCDSRGCAPPPQEIPIERTIPHPKGPCLNCKHTDIALMRLSSRVQMYDGFVQPICLPVNPTQDMGFSVQDLEGKRAWGAGWGDTLGDSNSTVLPDVPVQLEVPIQTLPPCLLMKNRFLDKASAFCAGGEGNDFCKGDSGNPLTLTNDAGNRVFLIGIVSSGQGKCGADGTQSLYTNVSYYVPWILSNLEP